MDATFLPTAPGAGPFGGSTRYPEDTTTARGLRYVTV